MLSQSTRMPLTINPQGACGTVGRGSPTRRKAEVNAIRAACKKLGTWDLSGCVMYTSCECCPMCYATAYWAGIRNVFYAASWSDYNDLFSDEAINHDMQRPKDQREIKLTQILKCEACNVWDEFRELPDGARY